MAEVVVVGGGPAGWALAAACAREELRVTLVTATRGWPATYGMWLDETVLLPPGSRWVGARVRGGGRWLSREYVVLDNESVRAGFAHDGIDVVKGRAAAMSATGVRLVGGDVLRAGIVFDATGAARRTADQVEQTAFGVVVPGSATDATFMDWRQPPGFGEPATFLYAVPLPDGRVLLEETCLARRPGLGFGELRDRLTARVGPLDGPVERVRFPVDVPPPSRRARGPVKFGAAAGLVHPATGFSLADTFRLAPRVASAVRGGPGAVRRVLWPARARLVYRLRRRGLGTLLSLTAAEHEEFFDLFFALPDHHQRAYLSGRDDPLGTAVAMVALFRAAPARLRRKMIKP